MNQNFAIAAGHEAVVETAKEVLKAGGNAFDAVVAAFVAGWIAEPCMTGAGGGAFVNLITETGKTYLLDFFCQTPKQKRPSNQIEFFPVEVNFGTATEIFHIGKGSTAVPGAVAGIFAIHEHFGTIPMKELIQPAIDLAKNGVVINNFQYLDFELLETILRQDSKAERIYFEKHPPWDLKFLKFKDFMEQNAEIKNYKIVHRQFSSHVQFYRSVYNLKDYHITAQELQDFDLNKYEFGTIPLKFKAGDTLMICEKKVFPKLEAVYEYETLKKWDTCKMLVIK